MTTLTIPARITAKNFAAFLADVRASDVVTAPYTIAEDGSVTRTYHGCARCGGTGIYSQYHGTCFDCAGHGGKKGVFAVDANAAARLIAKSERKLAKAQAAADEANATHAARWSRFVEVIAADDAGLAAAYTAAHAEGFADARGRAIVLDIETRHFQRGSISDAQRALVVKIGTPEAAAPKAPGATFGTVGERSTFSGTVERVNMTEGFYGLTTIVNFRTYDGALVVWFASGAHLFETGAAVTVTARVKEHGEYNGEPQTKITRASVETL